MPAKKAVATHSLDMETKGRNEIAIDDRAQRSGTRALTVAARSYTAPRSAAGTGSGGFSLAPRRLADHPAPGEVAPVWLAALVAAGCQAKGLERVHEVCWRTISGRAIYTNFASHEESIEPLGVSLPAGDTLAVSWYPGDTAYTVEVYSNSERCA